MDIKTIERKAYNTVQVTKAIGFVAAGLCFSIPLAHSSHTLYQEWASGKTQTNIEIEVSLMSNPETKELDCLAEAIYFEARGENLDGQKSVANVIRNRVESEHFPDTYCTVVYQPYQFSYTNGYIPEMTDEKAMIKAYEIADLIMNRDYDRTQGALYYYNPAKLSSTPDWVDESYYIRTADNHRFYSWHKQK